MLTIRCAKCKARLFKYRKYGGGRLLRCWKERIVADYTVKDGDEVKCKCGNLIGIDMGKMIKMKQSSYDRHGSITRGKKK